MMGSWATSYRFALKQHIQNYWYGTTNFQMWIRQKFILWDVGSTELLRSTCTALKRNLRYNLLKCEQQQLIVTVKHYMFLQHFLMLLTPLTNTVGLLLPVLVSSNKYHLVRDTKSRDERQTGVLTEHVFTWIVPGGRSMLAERNPRHG